MHTRHKHPSHPLRQHTTYFNTPRLKTTIFNNARYTTNISTNPHIVTTTDIKTNMRHIHTSIVSRHLTTRGNNKILRTPPPHISSSEEILPRIIRRTLAQLITIKSPFLNSYLHKIAPNHIHHHYAPSGTLTHTTRIISSNTPTYTPHSHPWICVDRPRWSDRTVDQMDGEAGWWTTNGKIGPPPTSKILGSG